ncbi:hypothetical protein SS1G_01644 [Sclerotinia sclerotiorum 1980 UF-70]|uniref:Uncharacterized protein n=1 Tax=Sclerotinia sclerotiorum (strain ATCC 18683 / 1980 / Ss-1) TaxID=665079 RepID=A7E8L6_SCLS1|nr:hypothetical protein SS1G_01644 [Sclerotinia sclerotiorum 1980 UF-70]EDN96718.1 hypothetical protein SS1G_01644 [Sclerotinia sclerotiorum 1980 UF-70]
MAHLSRSGQALAGTPDLRLSNSEAKEASKYFFDVTHTIEVFEAVGKRILVTEEYFSDIKEIWLRFRELEESGGGLVRSLKAMGT